jgi:prepilin-type processing-associated H-X9-DG protein
MTVGLNFLMGDGHVEFREMRWAMETNARAGATSRLPKPGDANRDWTVDFADLLAVARNFGKSDQPFTHGDFNYDGTVNFADLLILARNYNPASTVVGAVAASAPVLAATAAPDRRDPLKPGVLSARPSVAVNPKASPAAKARR